MFTIEELSSLNIYTLFQFVARLSPRRVAFQVDFDFIVGVDGGEIDVVDEGGEEGVAAVSPVQRS